MTNANIVQPESKPLADPLADSLGGNSWLRDGVTLALLALLLFSRNPARVLHPVLYAEDGAVWFFEAYNNGLASLAAPHTGYLQSFPRLVALLGLLLPLIRLPAWFILAGSAMQLAPVALMLRRGASIIPSAAARWALILFYIGMPNSRELYLNLTDAQWHFALVSFLLVVLAMPRGAMGRAIQYGTLLLGGISGPFSLFLTPIAVWHAIDAPRDQRRHTSIQAGLVAFTALIQTGYVAWGLHSGANAGRPDAPLGASGVRLMRILADQIFLGGMIGTGPVRHFQLDGVLAHGVTVWTVALLSIALLAVACWRGPALLRKLALYGGLILAAGLAMPVVSIDTRQWVPMAIPGVGCRYYFLAILVWFAAVLSLVRQGPKWPRYAARLLLPCFLIGVAVDWEYNFWISDTPRQFHHAAKLFARAAPGTTILLPEDPPGWTLPLTKH